MAKKLKEPIYWDILCCFGVSNDLSLLISYIAQMSTYITASVSVLRECRLDFLLPLMVALRVGKIVMHFTVMKFLGLGLTMLGLWAVVRSGKLSKYLWVNVCLAHMMYFGAFQLPRFLTLVSTVDLAVSGHFRHTLLAINLVVAMSRLGYVPIMTAVNVAIYGVVGLISLYDNDYWMVYIAFTELVTHITIYVVRAIDKRRLYDKVVFEFKMIMIQKTVRIVTSMKTFESIKYAIKNSLSVRNLSEQLHSVWSYLTAPSDVSLKEYLETAIHYLDSVKLLMTTLTPPVPVQYVLVGLYRLPLTLCLVGSLLSCMCLVNVCRVQTIVIIMSMCCIEIMYMLYANLSLLQLVLGETVVAGKEIVEDKLDTIIDVITVTSVGINLVTVVIEMTCNAVKKVTSTTVGVTTTAATTVWNAAKQYPKTAIGISVGLLGVGGLITYIRRRN